MELNNKDLEVGYYQCKDYTTTYVTKMVLVSDLLFKLSTYPIADQRITLWYNLNIPLATSLISRLYSGCLWLHL